MADSATQTVTDDPTQDGGDPAQDADTNQATPNNDRTYSKEEFDREVNSAVQTASAQQQRKLDDAIAAIELKEAQAEQKRLEEAGKHEELYHSKSAELEALRADNKITQFKFDAQKELRDLGLTNHDSLIGNTDSIEIVVQRAEQYKSDVAKGVEDGIRERLGTGVNHVPTQNTNTTDKPHDQKTPEEFKAWKEQQGLY